VHGGWIPPGKKPRAWQGASRNSEAMAWWIGVARAREHARAECLWTTQLHKFRFWL